MKKYALLLYMLMPMLALAQQNVILIIADDLGSDYCGFSNMAADTANMPNIRALANKGVVFNNAWAAPNCSPTRAGILTGRYSFRTGVGTAITGTSYPDLDTAEMTIAKMLKYYAPVKYATANIGKWHLNHQTPTKLNYPAAMGYDLYAGNFLGELTDYYNWTKITNGTSTTVTNYATTEAVNDAINWVGGLPANKPFFLWLAFNAPHTPFHKPPTGLYTVSGLTGVQSHINQNPKLYFKAMIEAMDSELGRLIQQLAANGRLDSTNFIFIGDNGNLKKVSQIADTTHTKGTLYQYGVQVPFMFSGPAVSGVGRKSDALINTTDIFATVAEVCGYNNWTSVIPSAKPVDSKSLLPILKNQAASVRTWAFTEQFNPTPIAADGKAIRNDVYKLIVFDNGVQEFYKLDTDPNEQNDIINTTRSTTDVNNYFTLCNELSTLTGKSICKTTISIAQHTNTEQGIKIYPNPTNDDVFVQGTKAFNTISITDMAGKLVTQVYNQPSTCKICVQHLISGFYQLHTVDVSGNHHIVKLSIY